MSILVVQILPQGIIFGADRNVTETSTDVITGGTTTIKHIYGQSQRPKVLRWPNNKALVGYVGAAEIAGRPTDEWLYDFIGWNIYPNSLQELAFTLRDEVENRRKIDEGSSEAEPLIIHLGGFEKRGKYWVPEIWFIRNVYKLIDGEYDDFRKEYQCSEELWKPEYFGYTTPENIRSELKRIAEAFEPFWFHQGFGLRTFNVLEAYMRDGFKYLVNYHPGHSYPATLKEFERHLKMSILIYESYFQAFKGPAEQYVGGGVDTVKIDWPL